jgi:hypothetical protein
MRFCIVESGVSAARAEVAMSAIRASVLFMAAQFSGIGGRLAECM